VPAVAVRPVVGVVIVGAASTVMVKALVEAVTPLKSVTLTTMPLKIPAVVGVPEIVPVDELIVSPPGNGEPVKVYTPGGLATVLVIGREYVAPTDVVRPVVGVVIVVAITVMVKVPVETATPALSVNVTLIPVKEPGVVGVPEIVPFPELIVSPAGNVVPVEVNTAGVLVTELVIGRE
jgi:hypothetical protein